MDVPAARARNHNNNNNKTMIMMVVLYIYDMCTYLKNTILFIKYVYSFAGIALLQ